MTTRVAMKGQRPTVFERLRTEFAKTTPARFVAILWVGFLIGAFARSAFTGNYIFDAEGRPVPGDFLAFWSAGKMVLSGHATQAYDLGSLYTLQIKEVGHWFFGVNRWVYPPLYFLVAIPLALLPYPVAFLGWSAGTLAGYFAAIGRVFRDRSAAVAFGLTPACLSAFLIAQNGLFTAALMAGALLTLRSRPIVSGLLFGALTYKPQFAVLIPFALLAGAHWRALITAALFAIGWLLLTWIAGPPLLGAFVDSIFVARHDLLTVGIQGWHKLESVYGYLRLAGVADATAMAVQIVIALASAIATIVVWKGRLSFETKATTLPLLALIATPYAYIYDYPLLSVSVAFLYVERKFDRFELSAIWAAYAAQAITLFTGVPLCIPAALLVAIMVSRRLTRPYFSAKHSLERAVISEK